MSEPVTFDLMDQAIHADPYPAYARLRDDAPVHKIDGPAPVYLVSRHADIDKVLHDHIAFSSNLGLDVPLMSMVMKDPPDHSRLRSTVSRAFTPRAIRNLEVRIEAVAEDFATALVGPVDFVAAFANPLPVTVICEMLGVPLHQRERMNGYARDALLASFAATGMGTPEIRAEAELGLTALMDILDHAIETHIATPRDNIISDLVKDEASGKLTRAEMRHLCALLLIAGHETTANLIANGMHHLAAHPQLMAQLKAEPALIAGFIEELVRFGPPLQRIMRRTTKAVEIEGYELAENSMVMLLPGAGNRDHRVWDNADTLDPERNTRGHLGFGTGIHVCPGAPLARTEARIAFEVLLRTIDTVEFDPDSPATPIVGYGAGSLGWNTLPLIVEPI